MNDFYSQQWLNHCYDGFPRKIGFVKDPSPLPKKEMIYTPEEFLQEVWTHVAHVDIFVAVFNEWQKQTSMFNKVFIDLDSDADHLEVAYRDMQEIVSFLGESTPRVYFSGSKGFHLFFDFPTTKFKHYKEATREWVEHIEKACNLTTVDYSVVGEIERVSRLPFTKHTGTNQLCVPIIPSWSLEAILSLSSRGQVKHKWLFIDPRFDEHLGILLHRINVEWKPPAPIEPLEIDTQGMDEDLAYIMRHAPNFKGVKRIIWTKVLPLMKLQNKSSEYVSEYCRELCQIVGREWEMDLGSWIRAAYKTEKGIPWSWSAIFHNWPEMRKWFQ